jgi:hypothetical protein
LDIPQESLAFVPHIPISQILMGDISMLERDSRGGSVPYPRNSASFKSADVNYEPMSEVASPHSFHIFENLGGTGSRHTYGNSVLANCNALVGILFIDI